MGKRVEQPLQELMDTLVCINLFGSKEESENFLKHNDTLKLLKKTVRDYSKDKNSSTLREKASCVIAGFRHSTKKLSFDGYFDRRPCEVKPQNVTSRGSKKLDGEGHFSDYTWRTHRRYSKRGVTMVSSGFIDGRMMFCYTYPFREIREKVERELKKVLLYKDIPGRSVRSACGWRFSTLNTASLTVCYVSPSIYKFQCKMTQMLFSFLTEARETGKVKNCSLLDTNQIRDESSLASILDFDDKV